MSSYKTFEGDFQPRNARFGVVVGRFNEFITERLLAAALDTLKRHGVEDSQIEIARVPGAYEIPLAAKKMATAGKYDAIIALACVIRGATPHFDYVAGACERGLSRVSLDYDKPIGFGVLTVDTVDQAIERAGSKAGNKGADAAMAALEMVNLLRQLE